ncbi:MAG TPA: MBL fold metallo-hydrolase [Thermaerobacter sp.]
MIPTLRSTAADRLPERPVEENCWELAPGLYRIQLPLPWDVPFVNAYLIEAPGGWILVDAGVGTPASLRALGWALRAAGVPEGGLAAILLTHRHPDHAGDVIAVGRRWGGAVYVHPADMDLDRVDPAALEAWIRLTGMPAEVMDTLLRRAERMPLPGDVVPYPQVPPLAGGDGAPASPACGDGEGATGAGGRGEVAGTAGGGGDVTRGTRREGDGAPSHGAASRGAREISRRAPGGAEVAGQAAGQAAGRKIRLLPVASFSVAGLELEVVHVPGHAPGHVMLHVPAKGWVLTGDHVLPRAGINVWANPAGPADPLGAYLDNLAAVEHLDRLWGIGGPGEVEGRPGPGLVLPGHGLPWRGPMRPHAAALVEWHQQAALALRDRLPDEPGPTAFEIVAARRPDDARQKPHRLRGAVAETLAFLLWLEGQGLAGRRGEAPARWYRLRGRD